MMYPAINSSCGSHRIFKNLFPDQRQLEFPNFTTNVDTATGRQTECSLAQRRLPACGLNCFRSLRVRFLQIQHLLPRFLCQVKRREPKGRPEFHLGGAWPITIVFTRLCIVYVMLLLCRGHGRYPLWICRKRKADRCNLLL